MLQGKFFFSFFGLCYAIHWNLFQVLRIVPVREEFFLERILLGKNNLTHHRLSLGLQVYTKGHKANMGQKERKQKIYVCILTVTGIGNNENNHVSYTRCCGVICLCYQESRFVEPAGVEPRHGR